MKALHGIGVVAFCCALTHVARADEVERPWGAVAAGVTIGVLTYAPAVLGGGISIANGNTDGVALFVPVVGPFIAAPIFASENDSSKTFFAAMLVVDGVAQSCAFALTLYGALATKHVVSRVSRVFPVVSPHGVAIVGTF